MTATWQSANRAARPTFRRRRLGIVTLVAAVYVGLLTAPTVAAEASPSLAPLVVAQPTVLPAAAPAPAMPQADGQTLPCANTSLDCVTLRFDNPDTSYLAAKHWIAAYLPTTRAPSFLSSVPRQFAWKIETSPISTYVLIRQAGGEGKCIHFDDRNSTARERLDLVSCEWSDVDQHWYFRPVDGTQSYQIVQRNGSCLSSQGGIPWGSKAATCVSPDDSADNWQLFVAQGDEQKLFRSLAAKSAFASCFDAKQADTGRCDFTADVTAAAVTPVVREQCARIPGGAFPLTNNSDTPQDFTISTERSSTGTSNWKDAFKGAASLDGLLGKVLKVSAEYTKEYGGSVSESTKETESRKLTVGPHRKAWVFYRDILLPIPGTWTFEKGTGHEWTYPQVAEIDVVGSGSLTRERVDNFVPTSEVIGSSWNCTLRGAPEIMDRNQPIVNTGDQSNAPTVGQQISVSTGTWNESGEGWTYGYRWQLNGQPIATATGSTYVVRPADLGGVLSVRVSAAHKGYLTGYADSTRTLAVVAASAGNPPPSTSTTDKAAPVGTAPASTAPATTAPATTAPATTAPATTAPATTAPGTTAPGSASSPAPSAATGGSTAAPTTGDASGVAEALPAPAAAKITPSDTDPSTAGDPLSVMVRLVTTSAAQFRGEAILLDGSTELERHPMSGAGSIMTDTFVLPADLAPGDHDITVRFVPDDPTLFETAEATLGVTAT